MKPPSLRIASAALAAALLLPGCATKPPPEFHGRWTPVNRYSDRPTAIPLRPAYLFTATPVDRTLKGLLERWSRDSGLPLDYASDVDFTLYRPVADIRSDDVHAAVAQLGALYAPQQVRVDVEGGRIVVRRANAPAAASTSP